MMSTRRVPMTIDSRPDVRVVLTDLTFPESPRWHDDRLWIADWGTQEVIALDLEGRSEVVARVPSFDVHRPPARRQAAGRLLGGSAPPAPPTSTTSASISRPASSRRASWPS
jgi:sugar lactone lactonase YvrE